MKNIAFCIDSVYFGGTETALASLVKPLSEFYTIDIIYNINNNEHFEDIISPFANFIKLDSFESRAYDVVIWCNCGLNFKKWKKKIKSNKFINWVHGDFSRHQFMIDGINNDSESETLVCVSKELQEEIKDYSPIENIIINNFVDVDRILAKSTEEVEDNFSSEVLKLVTVSRLALTKGWADMRNLANILTRKSINFEWIIIGDIPYEPLREHIKKLFKDLPQVKFLGKHRNPYPYMNKADYSVLLSQKESWGLVITESLVLETPVIISNLPVLKSQIQDEQDGIIFTGKPLEKIKIASQLKPDRKTKFNYLEFTQERNITIIEQWKNLLN